MLRHSVRLEAIDVQSQDRIHSRIGRGSGSLASRAARFQELVAPILRSPAKTFDWRVGNTAARAFAGEASGSKVVVFVAKEGAYQGRVLSAIVPDAAQAAQWGL